MLLLRSCPLSLCPVYKDFAPTELRHELRKWTHLFGFPASTCLGTLINSSGTSPLPTIHEKIAYPHLGQSRPSRIS
jgi:hypothetical protein